MTRKKHDLFDSVPFHITIRANNKEPFVLPLSEVWEILCLRLFECSVVHDVQPHALVLMPNHIHLLVTPAEDVSRGVAMRDWIRSITRDYNRKTGRSGRVFGGRYHGCAVQSDRYFITAYKYVYRNPVRAGLCQRVEDYPFSSLNIVRGNAVPGFKLWDPSIPIGWDLNPCLPEVLEWLNEPTPKEKEEQIRKALAKTRFRAVRGVGGVRESFRESLFMVQRPAESNLITSEMLTV